LLALSSASMLSRVSFCGMASPLAIGFDGPARERSMLAGEMVGVP
jgi:hypothetical protein